ncbi:MAG: hypothetical protein LQ346_000935 [Caloplaca aetnensis]|nr:MAG: hypothetical protein LQ346_000935 [Caloplaca aetnensis]
MAYLAPIHRPSSVRHALRIRLISPDEQSLVVAKANLLEVYAWGEDGIALCYSQSIYGKVMMLEKLQFAQSPTEHLFVGTDRFMYFTLSWDNESRQFRTEKTYVDQADKTSRDSQTQDRCLVDPTKQYMALHLYDGIITVLPLIGKGKKRGPSEALTLGEPVPTRIKEFFVRSSCFLYPRDSSDTVPQLAILYEDNHQKVCLSIKNLDYSLGGTGDPGSATLNDVTARDDLELGASHVIPVPAPCYGLFILTEMTVTYIDVEAGQITNRPLGEPVIFVTWASVDAQRWLLADDYGRLFLMMLVYGDYGEKSIIVDMIGQTSRASVLVYLDNGLVFVGSHQGDSEVVKIHEKAITVVQKLDNVAPILDFTIMDMGNRNGETQSNEYSSGQARIVTGSGAFQDGSLRSIRSGVGMEEQGILGEMDHIFDLFSFKSGESKAHEDVLVASFADETRVFHFSGEGEVDEQEDFHGLSLLEGTLCLSNITGNRLLQVTRSAVKILDLGSGMVTAEWSAGDADGIAVASANEIHLVVSTGGSGIINFDLDRDLHIIANRSFPQHAQISCIHVPAVCPDICVVGLWQTASVAILDINSLETIQEVVMSDDAVNVPRSVVLTQLVADEAPTLLVAMANGEVVTFSVNPNSFDLSSRKATILGTQEVTFKVLPRNDQTFNVFAICEHSSLIYGLEGRIMYAAVTAEEASCVCSFDCEAYPGAIAVATSKDLRIALVDTERTTHVQTLPLNATVRRVAYSPKFKAFGIGTIHRELREGYEIVQSYFKLADEVMFKELDNYTLYNDELVESCIRADLRDGSDELVERFIVGTAYMDPRGQDIVRGRILVFAVTTERSLKLVGEIATMGACRALEVINGNIVAALVKTVVIYSLNAPKLDKLATYRTSTAPIALAVCGSQIAVADIMKSVSVIAYKRPTHPGGSHSLIEVARHFQTAWATAVAHVDEYTWLESDAEGNLMVLKQNVKGVTADDQRRLEVVSEIRLGEMVNRIRKVDVESTANAVVKPKAFMGTVDGSVYLFALIADSKQDLLMRLQGAIAARVQSLGHVPFNTYRAFKNTVREAEEPFRFVDGDLIEKFLNCSASVQEAICKDLGLTEAADVEEMRAMVEGLRRIH